MRSPDTDSPPLSKAPRGKRHDGSAGPDLAHERLMLEQGWRTVAGIDEAGRGPLAGPVVAAAVILDANSVPDGLDDSKRLDAGRREALFAHIITTAEVAIASVPAEVIDRINIRQAALAAMVHAARALPVADAYLLIDGRDVPPPLGGRAAALIKGDRRSASIAAASIVAKVTRDAMMAQAASHFPGYGFERHKGYGTPAHLEALRKLGPCPLHRHSFAPLRKG